ncbi:MAG: DUF5817 domain-containing protein [Halodesulfurarchaeum sp.]
MFRVVGCSNCDALWIVEGDPDRTQCPRCRTRHQFDRLRAFVETDSKDEAREVRTAMLAARQDAEAAYESLDSVSDMEAMLDEAGIDDAEFLAANGIDPSAVAAASERATETRTKTSRRDRVIEAVRTLDAPSEGDVVEYAGEYGVPAEYVRNALEKLERDGTLTRTEDGFRLL